ncbi:hypothetical protein ABPG72_007207 [Tetrahymena utriculariae]
MLEELEKHIQKEKQQYKNKKQTIESKLSQMPISLESENKNSNLTRGLQESQIAFKELQMHSKTIEQSVQEIQNISQSALMNFETLKYRKMNIEQIINTMTAFQELRRILPLLDKCAETKNIDEANRHMKNYKTFQQNLICEFNKKDFEQKEEVFKKLVDMAKNEFEEALKKNDTVRLHKCTELSEYLGFSENSLDRVISVYQMELKEQLQKIENELFAKVPTNYKSNQDFKDYNFPFSQHYINILQKLAHAIGTYKDNIYAFYKLDGIFTILKKLVNETAESYINSLYKKLYNYYEIDKINPEYIHNASKQDVDRVDFFCEEASNISNQNEHFNQYIIQIVNEMIQKEPLKQEHKAKQMNLAKQNVLQMQTNNKMLEVMGNFLKYQKSYTKNQINQIIKDSPAFIRLWNFDKVFFFNFIESEESLFNIQKLHEYLDEIFFIIKNCALRALESLNKSTACAILNFISQQVIHEDVYYINEKLFSKWLKRENFNTQAISFNNRYIVHNTFVAVLFNNIQMLKIYIQKLSQQLLQSVQELFPNEDNGMLIASIEEINDINDLRFSEFMKQKIKILVDQLKLTIKSQLDDLKNINFTMNEQQQQEYEKGSTYSTDLKMKFSLYLNQWKNQFTKENYELFMTEFSQMLAENFERVITDNKKYHLMGAFLLDKEIRNIVNFLQNVTLANVKPCFQRLQIICEILKLENNQELQEFCTLGTGDFSRDDIRKIIRLRTDFK